MPRLKRPLAKVSKSHQAIKSSETEVLVVNEDGRICVRNESELNPSIHSPPAVGLMKGKYHDNYLTVVRLALTKKFQRNTRTDLGDERVTDFVDKIGLGFTNTSARLSIGKLLSELTPMEQAIIGEHLIHSVDDKDIAALMDVEVRTLFETARDREERLLRQGLSLPISLAARDIDQSMFRLFEKSLTQPESPLYWSEYRIDSDVFIVSPRLQQIQVAINRSKVKSTAEILELALAGQLRLLLRSPRLPFFFPLRIAEKEDRVVVVDLLGSDKMRQYEIKKMGALG